MPKGTGIYGAYKNAKPIQADFGDNVLQDENMRFKYREEDRIEEDRKNAKDKDLRERIVKARKSMHLDATGLKSEDEKRGALTLQASDVLNEAKIKLEQNPNDIEASLVVSNLEDFPARFKQMTDNYSSWMNDGVKGIQDEVYSGYLNKDNIDNVEKVIKGQVEYGLDSKGNITGTYDRDGDGVSDFSWEGMATGIDLPEYKKRFNMNGFMTTTKGRYGTTHTKNNEGEYEEVEIKELGANSRASIAQDIEETFGGSLEDMTDDGKSFVADTLNLDPETMTEDEFKNVKTQFLLDNVAMWDTKKFETKNWQDENQDKNRSFQWARLNAEKDKKSTPEQEEADFLRTLVDGTISGDAKAVGAWVGRVIGKDGSDELRIDDSEYTGDRLILSLSNGTKKVIDMNDKNKAIGELTSMSNVKKQPQDLMKSYETGRVMRSLEQGQGNKYSRILFGETLSNIDESKGNEVKGLLKEMGFKADNGGWFSDNETINIKHNGQKVSFDVSTDAGRKELQEFVIENGKIDVETGENKTTTPRRTVINSSELEQKALDAGYEVEEYRELLIQNGVEIKD